MIEKLGFKLFEGLLETTKKTVSEALARINSEALEKKRNKERKHKVAQYIEEKRARGRTALLTEEEELKIESEIDKILLDKTEEVLGSPKLSYQATWEALRNHTIKIKSWSSKIGFAELGRFRRSINDVHTDLNVYLTPRIGRYKDREKKITFPMVNTLEETDSHCIILGHPGAGKTTSMKKLCYQFFEEETLLGCNFPLLIKLRDLTESELSYPLVAVFNRIFKFEIVLNVQTSILLGEKGTLQKREEIERDLIIGILNDIRPLVILEGFDEISSASLRDSVLRDIRYLTSHLYNARVLVTCRTGEFNYDIECCERFEISPLSEEQIEEFAGKWLKNESHKKDFLSQIRKTPYWDTTIRPLSLVHLCAIYLRIQEIPEEPKEVYEMIVDLLIKEWDEQREVKRNSKFKHFRQPKKKEFLIYLAFRLTSETRKFTFERGDLVDIYDSVYKELRLPESGAEEVFKEIESHTGLLLRVSNSEFEFAHKSMQEYLAAEHIKGLGSFSYIGEYIPYLAAELAIATSLSTRSSLFFCELVFKVFSRQELKRSFYEAFSTRLVSENPSFTHERDFVLAALIFTSEWNNSIELIDVLAKAIVNEDKRVVLEYYELESVEKDHCLILKKLKEYPGRRLPKYLRVSYGFFVDFESFTVGS